MRRHVLTQSRTGARLGRAAGGDPVGIAGRSIRSAIRLALGEGRRAGAHARAHGERTGHGDEFRSGHDVPLVSASLLFGF